MATRLDFSTLSLMDALDMATLIEVEAVKRYQQFAERLGTGESYGAAGVFQDMVVNENKHGTQLAERRIAMFGNTPPKVKLSDIFDVEAPDVGSTTANMSVLKAYQVALSAERKAYDFYDNALRFVSHAEVKSLFEELREEEAEHVDMLKALIEKLPASAADDLEDLDSYPNQVSQGRTSPY